MPKKASIELKDLKLKTQIGTYKTGDTIPNEHVLDLTLRIDASLVLISEDNMNHVFDYDPLIIKIEHLAGDMHYETQERLMSRIVLACAEYPQIESLEIYLRKSPVREESGSLGLRLNLDQFDLLKTRVLDQST